MYLSKQIKTKSINLLEKVIKNDDYKLVLYRQMRHDSIGSISDIDDELLKNESYVLILKNKGKYFMEKHKILCIFHTIHVRLNYYIKKFEEMIGYK